MFWHLYPLHFNEALRANVVGKYNCPKPANIDALPPWRDIESHLPPLLRSYLQAGATIASEPALDSFFGCVDFLTILDLSAVNPKYQRRYF